MRQLIERPNTPHFCATAFRAFFPAASLLAGIIIWPVRATFAWLILILQATILLSPATQAQTSTDLEVTRLFPRPENLRVLAVTMLDTNRGVAVGEHGLVRRTSDGGLSWSATQIEGVDNLNAIAIAKDDALVAVGEHGAIVRSLDSGFSWTVVNSGALRLSDVSFAGDTGVAVGGSDMLRSTDGGLSWLPVVLESNTELLAAKVEVGGRAMASGREGSVFRSTDAGANWTRLQTTFSVDLTQIAVANANRWILFADTWNVYSSTDFGDTWNAHRFDSLTDDARAELTVAGFFNERDGFIAGVNRYGTRPRTPLYLTSDGGATWRHADSLPQIGDVHTTLGATATTFAAISASVGIAFGGSLVYRTRDAGAGWSRSYQGTEAFYLDLATVDSLTWMALQWTRIGIHVDSAAFEGVDRTTDGGHTWQTIPIQSAPEFPLLRAVGAAPSGLVIAVGGNGLIQRSIDGGTRWASVPMKITTILTDVDIDGELVVVCGQAGTVLFSLDAGLSWIQRSVPGGRFLRSVAIVDPETWFVTTDAVWGSFEARAFRDMTKSCVRAS